MENIAAEFIATARDLLAWASNVTATDIEVNINNGLVLGAVALGGIVFGVVAGECGSWAKKKITHWYEKNFCESPKRPSQANKKEEAKKLDPKT